MPSVLNRLRASGGPEALIILLEIICEAWDAPLVLCSGFTDLEFVTEDDRTLQAIATAMGCVLPSKDATASQKLRFAIANVRSEVLNLAEDAIAANSAIRLVYREYLSTDLTMPATNPWTFSVHGVTEQAGTVNVDCGLFDLVDNAYPRHKYDAAFAPALRYM